MVAVAGPVTVAAAIPWRPGTPERNAHHDRVRAHLTALLPDALHLDADSGHQPFSRAGSRNHAVRQAEAAGADVVVLCDADTLVEPAALTEALTAAHDGRLHLPFTWYRGLSQDGTARHLAGTPADDCPTDHAHQWATGGVLVITPAAWRHAGGMDEAFTGWGFEDTAFRVAADTLLGDTVRHHGTITHLWHPVEWALGSPRYTANARRMHRYRAAEGDPDAVRALITERAAVDA